MPAIRATAALRVAVPPACPAPVSRASRLEHRPGMLADFVHRQGSCRATISHRPHPIPIQRTTRPVSNCLHDVAPYQAFRQHQDKPARRPLCPGCLRGCDATHRHAVAGTKGFADTTRQAGGAGGGDGPLDRAPGAGRSGRSGHTRAAQGRRTRRASQGLAACTAPAARASPAAS